MFGIFKRYTNDGGEVVGYKKQIGERNGERDNHNRDQSRGRGDQPRDRNNSFERSNSFERRTQSRERGSSSEHHDQTGGNGDYDHRGAQSFSPNVNNRPMKTLTEVVKQTLATFVNAGFLASQTITSSLTNMMQAMSESSVLEALDELAGVDRRGVGDIGLVFGELLRKHGGSEKPRERRVLGPPSGVRKEEHASNNNNHSSSQQQNYPTLSSYSHTNATSKVPVNDPRIRSSPPVDQFARSSPPVVQQNSNVQQQYQQQQQPQQFGRTPTPPVQTYFPPPAAPIAAAPKSKFEGMYLSSFGLLGFAFDFY